MISLAKILSDIVGDAFEAEGLPADLGVVRVSDRPDLAQFQCNGAMAAAKVAKKNPREVAAAILERLEGHEALASVEIAGPGFVNLNLKNCFVSRLSIARTRFRSGRCCYAPPNRRFPDARHRSAIDPHRWRRSGCARCR